MDEETRALDRRFAVDLFNEVWRLLELPARTAAEDDRMLHAAHASRYHWGEIGEPVNFARGEWQVSRVYAVLGRAEPALYHARCCLAISEEHGIGDFDIAVAHEAIARAAAVAGDTALRTLGEQTADDDDRQICCNDIATVPGSA
jgi:hypothetical protein